MHARRNDAAEDAAGRELYLTRIFDAPRSLVFEAWTKGEHLGEWFAPHGFTIRFAEADVRPGGAWRCSMRSPEGTEHSPSGVYREVVRDKLLIFTQAWDGEDGKRGHETLVTVRFADHGDKTKLTLSQAVFASVEARDGHESGWNECLERLAALLAKR